MNITWDADKYAADFAFVHQYGNSVIELIDAGKGSSVLDLGCGHGALTKVLYDKGYSVKGLDASGELLNIARNTYPFLEFIQADAADFAVSEPVDVVFSNAVFHWIPENRQCDMLKCVHNAIRKNGQFVFEFGGYGNNQSIHEALDRIFSKYNYRYEMPFYFPKLGEYASLLESMGFLVKFAVLFDRLTELKGENGLKDWIAMFIKTPFSVVKSEQEKECILSEADEILRNKLFMHGKWHADYVRLRIKAIRA
ncbi:MAG: class I SAM-dependent methyltransferase [Desulfovibrionaceae bacterium]|nr:class I SAM-dependent methyltransferase [Desulfovibrionaceae bacterium]